LLSVSAGPLTGALYHTLVSPRKYVKSNNAQGCPFLLSQTTASAGLPGPSARQTEERSDMDRLRVGLFTEIYRPVVNGVVASVEALARGLRAAGHEVFCFAPKMPGVVAPEAWVLRIPSLPLPGRTPYRLTLPVVGAELKAVIERLDVVHVHSPFVTGWMGLRYARRYRMPLIYTYHTQLEAYAHYVPFEPNATRFAASRLTRAFANRSDAVIAPTPTMASRLRELGVVSQIETIPSGIDVGAFGAGRRSERIRESAGVSRNDRLLLYVGRLAKEKNLDLLLGALAQANDASLRLVVAGDGPQRADLERRARSAGIAANVRFLGVLSRDDLPGLYASADAFVMPSTTETQGIVLAEALAAGLPVIAADAPQNRDVLGSAGELVTPTAVAFAGALLRVRREPDPDLAADARRAAERFSIDKQTDATVRLYENLLNPTRLLDCEHTFV
jgi:1,2-diacylglycerol 3-alpha-glucosyltransferase